jgi:hypothetical protein
MHTENSLINEKKQQKRKQRPVSTCRSYDLFPQETKCQHAKLGHYSHAKAAFHNLANWSTDTTDALYWLIS